MNLHWRLILASASPRRRQLLLGLDLPVEVTSTDVDETPPEGMPHEQVAEHLAIKKAEAYTGPLEADHVLITADTTVIVDQHLLNKPADPSEARAMLAMLAGRTHQVVTGVCLRTQDNQVSFF